jgi:hypothetical protein
MPADLVKLAKGNEVWIGDVRKGETVTLDLSFTTDGEVEAYVRANVEAYPSGVRYRSSYYLHVTTSLAKAADEEGGSTKPVNAEANIPAASEPESPRAVENPESPGTIRIKGRFVYVNEDGGYSPARYMLVWIRDEDTGTDEWVASQWTDYDGNFDITCDNDDPYGRDPYAQLWAEGAWDWITTTSGGSTYHWNNPKCGDNVPDGFFHDYGTRVPTADNDALQAGDAVYEEAQWIFNRVTWMRPTKVTIRWPREDWPHCHGDYIDMPSKATAPWDHVVVHHEYAHAVQWTLYGNSWPPGFQGGTHWVYMEDVLPDAWAEGWAEFMQCAVDNDPNNLRSGGANIETNDWYNWQDTGDMDGAYIEGEVASILWDIFDPTSTADLDYMSWGFEEIFYVLKNDNPASMYDYWFDWIIHWNTLSTSIGPLSTIYWHYGIDRDYYAPHSGYIYINGGATYTTSTSVTLTLYCNDWGSGVTHMRFRNSLDDPWSSWYTYATSKSWTLYSGDGWKYVYVEFKDKKDYSTVYYDTIILDTVSPTGSIIINSGNPTYTTSTSVTLYLTYSDTTSGVYQVRYGNYLQPWTDWESPSSTRAWTLESGDGTKRVYYQIRDRAGKISTQYYDTIILDTTRPTGSIVINSGNPTYTTSTSVTLYLTYSDATSGVYQVRYGNWGESWTPWESPSATRAWTLKSIDGTRRVYYQIKDNAGWYSLQYYDEIILDRVAPVTTLSHSPGSSTVTLSATDATSGVKATYYRIDGGAWNTYTGPITLTGTGSHTIEYYSKDNAGKTESIKSQTFHYLTVNTDPKGLDAPKGEGWYKEVETAKVSVSTVTGYTFKYWYLDGASEKPYSYDLTAEVRMDTIHTATAKFEHIMCKVTFYTKPEDKEFSITFDDETYYNGETHNITYGSHRANANPPEGWEFDHWECEGNVEVRDKYSNPVEVRIECGGTLIAVFRPAKCEVTFYAYPTTGSITFENQTYTDGQSASFEYGTSGPATANPPTCWEFDHWEATDNVNVADPYSNPTTVTIKCGGKLKAVFRRIECEVTFYTNPPHIGSITFGEKTYTNDEKDTFPCGTEGLATANVPECWIFHHWETKDNVYVNDTNINPTLVRIECGGALIAVFKQIECRVAFYTSPSDIGSITIGLDGVTYTNGEIGTFPCGTEEPAYANAPPCWAFAYWEAAGNVYVSSKTANPTNITVKCGGTLKAVFHPMPDLVVTDVQLPYPDPILYEGIEYEIGVTVANIGPGSAESFNVSLELYWLKENITDYYAETTVSGLASGENVTVYFQAHTNFITYYTLTATADCNNDVTECDETNNDMKMTIQSRFPGDIDGDGKVGHKDLLLFAGAYGSEVGDPNYLPLADFDADGKVDHKDLLILASNFGKGT